MIAHQPTLRALAASLLVAACVAQPSPPAAPEQGPPIQPAAAPIDAAVAPQSPPTDAPAPRTAVAPAPAPVELELCEESRCGPAPRYPSRRCPDGIHTEGPGPCVQRPDGSCGWSRLTCPPPSGQQPVFKTGNPRILLQSRTAADRVRGAKMVRANPDKLGLRERSDAFAALLAACLSFPDEEVRLWAVMALETLDDRVVPILEKARLRETSSRVNQQIDAFLGRNRPAEPVITPDQCTKKNRKQMLTWPVRELCDPIGHYPPILFSLGDGTHIYKGRGKGPACFRGKRKKRCYLRCLPADARIDTPRGPVAVARLREGDPVWTFDLSGRRIVQPVREVGSVVAGADHTLTEVVLSDGRVLRASAAHPTVAGRVADLEVGSRLDGATVRAVRTVPLAGGQTFDLLPGGPSGLYVADGVILGSSLDRRTQPAP